MIARPFFRKKRKLPKQSSSISQSSIHGAMSQTNQERSLANKKRVIKMLFVLVLEYFIFWTPVFVLTTWIILDYPSIQHRVSARTKDLLHLLSYVSSCCNPITYCFMNKKFRDSFVSAFRCCSLRKKDVERNSSKSGSIDARRDVLARKSIPSTTSKL